MQIVAIVEELKAKLAHINNEIKELQDRINKLDAHKAAFETVIRTYDPGFVVASHTSIKRKIASPNSLSRRVTDLLKGKNNRHVALGIVRQAERPITSADIARQFTINEGLNIEMNGLDTALASRFSATMDGLLKQGLVRQAGTLDGRRRLWEINR